MSRIDRRFLARQLMAVCLFVVASPALADAKCTSMSGKQKDVLVATGCLSPIGFCTAGTIAGNHGLRGSSAFSGVAFDPIPNDPLGRLALSGTSTYTTADGAITISEVSVFDIAGGTAAGIGRIVGGAGAYAGATGDIFIARRVGEDGTSFTAEITGEICLP